ncbi:hypothetical protein TRAPUB_2589 [Trametes pubescens]|uniref:Uncharacterized protein n=1 Tax=Trametes pubescens TaxID=154538 RepID=A0A1M2VFX7_TRAPU|nr:hypothetical protein TRAPUB_2589 [Trametes pubescens]
MEIFCIDHQASAELYGAIKPTVVLIQYVVEDTQPVSAHPSARLLLVESSAGQSTVAIVSLSCQDTTTDALVGLPGPLPSARRQRGRAARWLLCHVGITAQRAYINAAPPLPPLEGRLSAACALVRLQPERGALKAAR